MLIDIGETMPGKKRSVRYSERVSIIRKELMHGGLTNSKGEIVMRMEPDAKNGVCKA